MPSRTKPPTTSTRPPACRTVAATRRASPAGPTASSGIGPTGASWNRAGSGRSASWSPPLKNPVIRRPNRPDRRSESFRRSPLRRKPLRASRGPASRASAARRRPSVRRASFPRGSGSRVSPTASVRPMVSRKSTPATSRFARRRAGSASGCPGFVRRALPCFPREDGDLALSPGGRGVSKPFAGDEFPLGPGHHGFTAGSLGPDGKEAAAPVVGGWFCHGWSWERGGAPRQPGGILPPFRAS